MSDSQFVYVSPLDKLRTERQAPCATLVWDENQKKNVVEYPNIRCGFNCDHCGWNPAVKKARIEKMCAELEAGKRKKRERKKNVASK